MTSVLDALGPIPSTLVTLDFESFYSADYSLSKLTTEAYVRDSRFETIGVGVKYGDRPSVWMEHQDFRAWAARVPWPRVAVLAHHAHFDGLVLSHHYGIRPGFWYCTLSMARALHGAAKGNGLEPLAERYGIGAKGHEVHDAKGKRRRDFTEAEWLAYGRYCNNDNELARRLFDIMRRQFSPEELWLIDTTVRMFTEPAFVVNQDVLAGALAREKEKKRAVLERVARMEGVKVPPGATEAQLLEAARSALSSNPKFAALLRAMGHEPPTKQNAKRETIFAFAKSDPGMQALLEHEDGETRALAEARLKVKSTIIETRSERMAALGRRGPAPIYLKYSGAHTHRWSGGDKMNPQNFNRGGSLRAALEAPDGHVLAVADSGQIEARVTAWVAGEASVLDTFRRLDALGYDEKGEPLGDFYAERGSVYFRKKVTKKGTPVERQTSKSMELGLGFGMGWFAFAGNLLKGFLGAPPVQFTGREVEQFGVDLYRFENEPLWREGPTGAEEVRRLADSGVRLPNADTGTYSALLQHSAVTHHLVRLYRTTNSRIAAYWKTCDRMLEVMAREDGDPDEVRLRVGPIEVLRYGLRKPNGMVLHYPKLHRSGSNYRYWGWKDGRPQWVNTYGGSLTENIVQSLARDIVAEQALWVRAAGYPVKTTTHDEIVSIVPEARGSEALAYMLQRMRTPPAWCSGLPLNASGATAKSYGDCK